MATLQDIQAAIGALADTQTALTLTLSEVETAQSTADDAVVSERATLQAAQDDFDQVLAVARGAAGFPAAFATYQAALSITESARQTLNALMAEYLAENP
jgi:hypothetical protein